MILYHPTFLVIALNVSIIVMLGFIGYSTQNPLVVLGLLMLQQTPVVDPSHLIAAERTEEVEEIDHESSNHRIGFLAKVKSNEGA